ncbi:hypothetical protein [Microvirga aerophila]|uniref:Uncharacterized protein n=1 Tax=Microvirga aerophila TaxID=670291 RepID=A0A512BTS4_9HYPH|nr:hypothetical protein [Microvirga aerophila]GEO15342.1 hypothetical protein MAE02_30380 [Microvirga aerophila]
MAPYDPDHLRRKLEVFEARTARHERITRTILILMTVLAVVASGVLLYQLLDWQ